jgi:tetratricopeptide (TPR) repeat protein
MVAERRFSWRRSALDAPLALLIALVLVQLVLGNGSLAAWALAPSGGLEAPPSLPSFFLAVGTIAPTHTVQALLVFLVYAGAYVLVVQLIRTRLQLDRLVSALLIVGGLLAFLGLLDYLGRDAWLLRWRSTPATDRLSGTFANPDHFGTWLVMLILLGVGHLLSKRSSAARAPTLRHLLRSPVQREEAARHYLPFVALLVMAVAVVFTLSRGAVVSGLVALLGVLALLGGLGRMRRSLALVAILLVSALGYAAWIGFEPFLQRVRHADYVGRWVQTMSSLPMLESFPVLGLGLGTYQDLYLRYQPAVLDPGHVYYTFAHNDLLQVVLELGVVGAFVLLAAFWMTGRDLVGAHLLGRLACPVGGGEAEGARRSDPFSVGLGVGALGAVLALLVHSVFDFSARIPANGILAATCLGSATVALHTRYGPTGDRTLTRVRDWPLGDTSFRFALGAMGVLLCLVLALWIVRAPMISGRLAEATRAGVERLTAMEKVEAAVALAPRDERARATRGRLRHQAAVDVWTSGATLDGRVLTSWEERQQIALPLATGAIQDFHIAVRGVPTEPRFHSDLARAEWTLAVLDPGSRVQHLDAALVGFSRAAVLAPNDPFVQRALATFAVPQGGQATQLGLRAGRAAVALDPGLLPGLVDQFVLQGLTPSQWIALVPETALDRADLGGLLEERALLEEAAYAYQRAVEVAPSQEMALCRWLLARLLVRQRHALEALANIDVALVANPGNPELYLARGQAFDALGDPRALEAHRLAILNTRLPPAAASASGEWQSFGSATPRARAVLARALSSPVDPARYRRALARYLTQHGFWDQALSVWDAVLVDLPRDAQAHFSRGIALDGLGMRDRSLDAYRQAVGFDGSTVTYRLRLAERLWETEQYYQAMNEWRTVVGLAPGNIEARLGLARASARAGDRALAAQEYARILQMVPDQPEARRELGRLGR